MALSEANRGYGASAVKSLVKKGVVETYDVRVERDPLGGLDLPTAPAVTMTMTQEKGGRGDQEGLVGRPRCSPAVPAGGCDGQRED